MCQKFSIMNSSLVKTPPFPSLALRAPANAATERGAVRSPMELKRPSLA
jgi:hypothetical protein